MKIPPANDITKIDFFSGVLHLEGAGFFLYLNLKERNFVDSAQLGFSKYGLTKINL